MSFLWDISFFWQKEIKSSLNSWCAKCALWIGGTCITWEHVRDAVQRLGSTQNSYSRHCISTRSLSSPNDSDAHAISEALHHTTSSQLTSQGVPGGLKILLPGSQLQGSSLTHLEDGLSTGGVISWNNKIRWE